VKASDILRLPVQPLWDLVHAENAGDLAVKLGIDRSSVTRWIKHGGIPLARCDAFAVELGFHPMSVWGDEWYDAEVLDLANAEKREQLSRDRRNAGRRRRRRERDGTAVGETSEGTASGELATNCVRARRP